MSPLAPPWRWSSSSSWISPRPPSTQCQFSCASQGGDQPGRWSSRAKLGGLAYSRGSAEAVSTSLGSSGCFLLGDSLLLRGLVHGLPNPVPFLMRIAGRSSASEMKLLNKAWRWVLPAAACSPSSRTKLNLVLIRSQQAMNRELELTRWIGWVWTKTGWLTWRFKDSRNYPSF